MGKRFSNRFRTLVQALRNGVGHTCIRFVSIKYRLPSIPASNLRPVYKYTMWSPAMGERKLKLISSMFLVLTMCSSVTVKIVEAADPDPLVDFSPNATTPIFRDIFTNGDVSTGSGGVRAALNIAKFPGLTSEGLTVVQFRMKPCGENVPHTHPRATELLSLISGGPLQAGFVDTKGEPHIYILYPGDLIVFPRGLLHFELNVGTETAFYLSALNSQNPGTLDSAGAVLQLPDRAAAIAFNQDLATVRALKSQRPYNEPPTLEAAKPGVCVPGQYITTSC